MYKTYGIAGKIIAGIAEDTRENVAWIVSDSHAPNLVEFARILRLFNGQTVRITIEDIGEETHRA